MNAGSANKLEALALIVGPVLALLFFLVEPGGMLIDPASPGDSVGKVTALVENSNLSHVVALMVPLGLLLMLYGLSGVNRVIVEDDTAAAVSRFGILAMMVGGFGWIISEGMTHVMAESSIGTEQGLLLATSVEKTGSAITIISSMAVSLGILAFSLSLAAREPSGFHKNAALVASAVSVLSLVALIIGHSGPNETMITVGRICYFPWVIWFAILSRRFLKAIKATTA